MSARGSPDNRGRGGWRGGRGRGGRERDNTPKDPKVEMEIQTVSALFGCPKQCVVSVNSVDPFNKENKLYGYVCKQDGQWKGSLYIISVNDKTLPKPLIIYGTPNSNLPYKPDTAADYIEFPTAKSFYLGTKWNGANVQFFKYSDADGKEFITGKPRMKAFLENNVFSAQLDLAVEALGCTEVPDFGSSLPSVLSTLQSDSLLQSISFELCGSKTPQLVKYDFPISLKPLFHTSHLGQIIPFVTEGTKIESFADSDTLIALCKSKQEEDLKTNEQYRKSNNIPKGYQADHYLVEGQVLFLLNESGHLIDRNQLYKIKPKDIELYHWEQFDQALQVRSLHALEKIWNTQRQVNDQNLRKELELNDDSWARFQKDILDFVSGRPNPASSYQAGTPRVLIMVGLPGSGKSTLANRILTAGFPYWERVNQDELGTRRKCEQVMHDALKKNKSVVVDRCNFDFEQRHHWFKIAGKYNVTRVDALFLDLPDTVCKARVKVRKNHPTIPEGDSGVGIIDKFGVMLTPPIKGEGFAHIWRVTSEAETNAISDTIIKST